MGKYSDIINLTHPTSKVHKRMSMASRAAQFSPFAALTGYNEEIKETARLTDKRIEIDETLKGILDNKLMVVQKNIKNKEVVEFTYFIYDDKKEGGKYITKKGIVRKIDLSKNYIMLYDKTKIDINEIINITGDIFNMFE